MRKIVGRELLADGAALASASVITNLIGIAITVVLAHSFDHAHFGALAALLGLTLVITVPATGLQYVVARRTSAEQLRDGVHDRSCLQVATTYGAGSSAVLALAAPLIALFLDVPVLAVVYVALALLPYTINTAQTGSLLGHAAFGRFAIAQLILAGLRLVAVATACLGGFGVTTVMLALLIATWLTVLSCVLLTGRRTWTAELPRDRRFLADIGQATLALAGISVIMNIDILLARHYLSPSASGIYALGALFAKAALWAAQFIPQLLFPHMSSSLRTWRPVAAGVALDLAIGAAVFVAAMILAEPLLRAVSGDGDAGAAARLAPWFAVLGTCWALCHLLLLVSIAARDASPARTLWPILAVEVLGVVLFWHHDAREIVVVCIVGTLTIALFGMVSAMRSATTEPIVVPV